MVQISVTALQKVRGATVLVRNQRGHRTAGRVRLPSASRSLSASIDLTCDIAIRPIIIIM